MKYPFVRPIIAPVERWAPLLDEAYRRRHFTNFGSIEQALTAGIQQRFAADDVAVTICCNATIGLTAALFAFDVQGAVVIPDFTFPATLQAVMAAGCEPVLCDVDPDTGEMDPAALSTILSKRRIAAVMPVRVYGYVRDFTPIITLARSAGAVTIVDAAAALGAGRVELADDVAEIFSLHATKAFGIGEGGAIMTSVARRDAVREALNFGLGADRRFGRGTNGKMSEFQAAIGLAQLELNDAQVAGRRLMAEAFDQTIAMLDGVEAYGDRGSTAWSNYAVKLSGDIDIVAFEAQCHAAGLFVRRYYFPTLSHGYRAFSDAGEYPVAADLSGRSLCVPLYADSTEEERAEIVSIFSNALHECRR